MSLVLTIAMPAFNEEGCVEETVREALGVIDQLQASGRQGEVLVVDDGSSDRTPEILASIVDDRLRVITHERNQGIGGFNRRMMSEARGDWVLFTSSDGEFDPHEGIRFMDIAQERGADAVLGYRTDKRYNTWRKTVSFSFNALTYLWFGTGFRDIGSTRLLRRSLFQPISLHAQSAFLNAERLLAGRRFGARIVEVPTVHRPRLAGVGGGAKLGKVVKSVGDMMRVRARWFRFDRNYNKNYNKN